MKELCVDGCPFRSTEMTAQGMKIVCAKDEKGGARQVGVLPIVDNDGKPMIDEEWLNYMWCLDA